MSRGHRLPYEGAGNGERALAETQRMLARFSVQSFGTMVDYEREAVVMQFRYRDMQIHVEASMKGYAAAWLQAHPYSTRVRFTLDEHRRRAHEVARHAVYSILRDWIKGQVCAIETGVLTFESAFLGSIMLPSGVTVHKHLTDTRLLPSGARLLPTATGAQ